MSNAAIREEFARLANEPFPFRIEPRVFEDGELADSMQMGRTGALAHRPGSQERLAMSTELWSQDNLRRWLDHPDDSVFTALIFQSPAPVLRDPNFRTRLVRRVVRDMLAEGVIWNPRLDYLLNREPEYFLDRVDPFGIPAAIEGWAARATDPDVVKPIFERMWAGRLKYHLFKACPVIDDESLDLALSNGPVASRLGENPHLQRRHVTRAMTWAVDSFHIRRTAGRAKRGSPGTVMNMVRSLMSAGHRIGRRGIDGLLSAAERGARTDVIAIGLLCEMDGLQASDIDRLLELTSDIFDFRCNRLLRNPSLTESDLVRVLDRFDASDHDTWAAVASRPEVRSSRALQDRLVESRSDRVLRALLDGADAGAWSRLFRTIMATRPAQAARVLALVGIPKYAELGQDDFAWLLQAPDRRVREAAIFAISDVSLRTERSQPVRGRPR